MMNLNQLRWWWLWVCSVKTITALALAAACQLRYIVIKFTSEKCGIYYIYKPHHYHGGTFLVVGAMVKKYTAALSCYKLQGH